MAELRFGVVSESVLQGRAWLDHARRIEDVPAIFREGGQIADLVRMDRQRRHELFACQPGYCHKLAE